MYNFTGDANTYIQLRRYGKNIYRGVVGWDGDNLYDPIYKSFNYPNFYEDSVDFVESENFPVDEFYYDFDYDATYSQLTESLVDYILYMIDELEERNSHRGYRRKSFHAGPLEIELLD